MIAWSCEAPCEHLDGSGEKPSGCAFDGSFEVFGKAAIAVQPCMSTAVGFQASAAE